MNRFGNYLAGLSDRERGLLLLVVTIVFFIAVGSGAWAFRSAIDLENKRVAARTAQLYELLEQRGRFDDARRNWQDLEKQLRKNNVRLQSFVELLARELEVQVGDMSPRTLEPDESGLQESQLEVSLRDLSADKLRQFLEQVEDERKFIKVKKLRMRKRFNEQDTAEVTLTLSTYKLAES